MINNDRIIRTFIELATIDSTSGNEDQIAKFLSKKLKSLGCTVTIDSYGNVIAKKAGKGKPFMLNAHMDTVEPGNNIRPIISGDIIKTDGSTVLGSDPKAGVATILEAIESSIEQGIKTRPLEIVFTREEETSLGGAINLDYSLIKAQEGIVFDGDEEVFKIFISSPTYYLLDVEIIGRGAHAGVEPEKGISAIEIVSKIINKLRLGRIDEESTMNIGVIQGGSVRNAVPEKVFFEGEIRSRNKKTLQRILKETETAFVSITKEYPEAKISCKLVKDFEGFKLSKTHPMILQAMKILKQMKLTPELKDSGGGSDANIFFTHDIEVIIVGTGVYEPHTTREYLSIPQMQQASEFCLNAIKQ